MIRKCFALFILVFAATLVFAHKTDSLLQAVKNSRTDTARMRHWKALVTYTSRNDPKKTFGFTEQAAMLAGSMHDSAAVAMLLKSNGVAHATLGNRDSAVYYYFRAIEILGRHGNKKDAAEIYNDIARFFRRDEPDRAISYYQKAMDIYSSLKDEAGMAVIWNESGVAYENKGNYAEAESRYRKSLDIAGRRGDTIGISYALSFISGVKAIKKEYAEAEKLSLEVLRLREAVRDTFAMAIALTNLGELYNLQGKWQKAIPYFEQSNAIAARISFTDIMAHNHGQLADAWEKSGDYKKALEAKKTQTAFNDSLFQLNKAKQIEEITTRYETAEKEKQIQAQAFALTRKNYLIALIISLAALGGGILFWLYARKNYRLRQQMEIEKRKQQEQAAREVLRAEESERRRIAAELHDGVGQLMSAARMNLEVFARNLGPLPVEKKHDMDRVLALVDEGCREVRNVSHSMMPNALLKKGLASALHDFIQKIDQQIIKTHLHVEGLNERMAPEVESVLYRIVQECVNNVIKHSGANRLDISLMKDGGNIDLTIEDNGKGFDTAGVHEGIGLQNIRARVQYLKGSIDIESSPGNGTFIGIHIPPGVETNT